MLVGKNIILRPLKIEDLEKTHEWRNNFELVKLTLGIRFPKTIDMENDWFNSVLTDKNNKNIYFGIDEKSSNDFIGIVQLNKIDWISRTTEFGIVIGDKEKHGKGYAKEAMDLLFDYAFNQLNLRKINLRVISFNKGAIRLYEKYGFKLVGELKKEKYYNNEYHSILLYSLFKGIN